MGTLLMGVLFAVAVFANVSIVGVVAVHVARFQNANDANWKHVRFVVEWA